MRVEGTVKAPENAELLGYAVEVRFTERVALGEAIGGAAGDVIPLLSSRTTNVVDKKFTLDVPDNIEGPYSLLLIGPTGRVLASTSPNALAGAEIELEEVGHRAGGSEAVRRVDM